MKNVFNDKWSKCLIWLAVSGAMLLGACNDDDEKDDDVIKQDVEVVFTEDETIKIMLDSIRPLLIRSDIDKIYLVPRGYMGWGTKNLNILRTKILEPSIALDPERVKGRGDFYFYPGNCSTADSLWFVQNGWTVNQNRH